MAILADASRLLAESLDFEQTLSSMARMAVPSFSDVVLVHLKDQQTGDPAALVACMPRIPSCCATLREMLRNGTYRGGIAEPSSHADGTRGAHFPVDARMAPRSTRSTRHVVALMRRFRVSSFIHVPIVSGDQPLRRDRLRRHRNQDYNPRDLAFAEELARRASHAMHNAQLFQAAKTDRERAEEAAALRERLVAIVGHDLRNPLVGNQHGGADPEPQRAGRLARRNWSSGFRRAQTG